MITYLKQDLTKIEHGVIAHGCNCQGVMGAGVARAIRTKYPKVFVEYKLYCDDYGSSAVLLGAVNYVTIKTNNEFGHTLYVANMFTQNQYGNDGRVYADLDAIEVTLASVILFAKRNGRLPLYMPKIGCGLGGLKWDEQVAPVVQEIAEECNYQIFVCDI